MTSGEYLFSVGPSLVGPSSMGMKHPASPMPDRCNLGTPDKRFEAKAKTDDEDEGSHVLLTRASDGTTLEPIMSVDQYRAHLIEEDDPGPTVRAAWEKWGE